METPPSLKDMGHVLWGPHWREALAQALDVTKEDVENWEADPASRPADLQRTIENLGVVRLEEIGLMLVQMKENGLAEG
ncbi:MAG TPA: hypothetical protein VFI23_13975 [Rhizomicrobium sp.]|nr:hypothetical protein [Rhizomicrobium sp.]